MRRYVGIDVLKFLCFCLVVFIHCPFPSLVGEMVKAIARIATPIFFSISGFFYNENVKSSLNKAFRYTRIYILMNVFLFLIYTGIKLTKLFELAKWSNLDITVKNIINAIVWGKSFGNEYLWFMHALGCLYLFLILLEKMKLKRKIVNMWYIWIGIFWVFSIGTYIALGKKLPVYLYRNWLIEGVAFFSFGNWMRNNSCHKINSGIVAILGSIMTIIEYSLFGENEFYLGTFLIIFGIMDIFVKQEFKQLNVLGELGKKYGFYLYLWHPFFKLLFSISIRALNINENRTVQWIEPFVVIILTILGCMGANKIKEKMTK